MVFQFNEKLRKISEFAIRCLYPKRCPVCDKIIPLNEDYCLCSLNESHKLGKDVCLHCGHESDRCVCLLDNSIILPKFAAVYLYGGKIRADILDLKFNNEKYKAIKLGALMAERCAELYYDIDFDAVTFVPMTEESETVRGYNQSRLLAEQVAEKLFLPVEDLFIKIRQTSAQHHLNGSDRLENVKNSVALKSGKSVKGKNILICDDVKTTGATLNQCVSVLKDSDADNICCICVAVSDFSL